MTTTNPLFDMVEKARQQKYADDLAEIKKAVDLLVKGSKSTMTLITLTSVNDQKVGINPKWIRLVKPSSNGSGSVVWPVTGDSIFVQESVETVINMANHAIEQDNDSDKKYIG